MIINSKFHDYYDTALAHGVDKTIVLNRHERYVETPHEVRCLPYRLHRKYNKFGVSANVEGFWLGFCGKIYYGERHGDDISYGKKSLKMHRNLSIWGGLSQERHDEIVKKDWTSTFIKLDTPYFIWDCGLHKNSEFRVFPNLGDLKFFKVFDAYTANQEIQMFLTNELARDKMIPEPKNADEYKVRAHGMDTVTSFRRSKGGPTRKRKKSQ